MENQIRCSKCKFLEKGNPKESFISPQGIPTAIYQPRYYCKADIILRFTDDQIATIKKCENFRPRILTLSQEIKQKTFYFFKKVIPNIILNRFKNHAIF